MTNRQLTPIKSGGAAMSMVPSSFDELQRMAAVFVKSKTFKRSYEADEEQALAECCIVIQRGLDVGLSPTQAVEGIAIIGGKTLIYGETLTAVLWAGGCKIKKWTEGEGDDLVAFARITRPDGDVIERSFSIKQAEKAHLRDLRKTVRRKVYGEWQNVPNDSPWHRFEDRMCEWRAFGWAVKDGASDFSKGLALVEEMGPRANAIPDADAMPLIASLPDVPDLPDPPAAQLPLPEVEDENQDAIADEDGVVEMISDALALASSLDDVQEIRDSNADLVARCSSATQDKIEALYDAAEDQEAA